VPVNALLLPVSQEHPPPAPAQGQPLGSGVLLPSLRLTSSMTFEDFYRSCGAALENYSKLPSGSQEKSRSRKQVSKRRVVYDWINRCLLQENGWELAAALEFMELARRAVMSAGKAMPLGLYVETVGKAVVCTSGRTNLEGVMGSRMELYGTLQQFRDRFVSTLAEYCQVNGLTAPESHLPEAPSISCGGDEEENEEDEEEEED
jgi:hypothetical protein